MEHFRNYFKSDNSEEDQNMNEENEENQINDQGEDNDINMDDENEEVTGRRKKGRKSILFPL